MPVTGVVFVTDPLQITGDLAVQAGLQGWFGDTAFWSDISHYVRFWGQETYADTHNLGCSGRLLEARRDYLNDYLQHALLLVRAGPGSVDTARTFLERVLIADAAYPRVPVDSAGAWIQEPAVSVSVMESFISSETCDLASRALTRAWRSTGLGLLVAQHHGHRRSSGDVRRTARPARRFDQPLRLRGCG